MTIKIYRLLAGTAFAAALTANAYAANPLLDKADMDKDGRITLSEFSAFGDQKFAAMDTDANGLVSKDERRTFRAEKRAERAQMRFDKTDTNSDGFISRDEHTAALSKRGAHRKNKMDVNGDGSFDDEDRAAIREKRKERRAERQAQRGQGQGGGHGKQKPDTNGDGMIDLAEHQSATARVFARLDKNNDGYLTGDEQRRPRRRNKHSGFGR